jgi:hypothetical protein
VVDGTTNEVIRRWHHPCRLALGGEMSTNTIDRPISEAGPDAGAARQGGNRLRRLHLILGAATLLAFLVTGAYMRVHEPPLSSLERGLHSLYRSRHIYILAAGVANLLLGSYVRPVLGRTLRRWQWVGSGMLVLSTLLLLVAFVVEPAAGRDPSAVSALGLFSLLAGTLLHLAVSLPRGR